MGTNVKAMGGFSFFFTLGISFWCFLELLPFPRTCNSQAIKSYRFMDNHNTTVTNSSRPTPVSSYAAKYKFLPTKYQLLTYFN